MRREITLVMTVCDAESIGVVLARAGTQNQKNGFFPLLMLMWTPRDFFFCNLCFCANKKIRRRVSTMELLSEIQKGFNASPSINQ